MFSLWKNAKNVKSIFLMLYICLRSSNLMVSFLNRWIRAKDGKYQTNEDSRWRAGRMFLVTTEMKNLRACSRGAIVNDIIKLGTVAFEFDTVSDSALSLSIKIVIGLCFSLGNTETQLRVVSPFATRLRVRDWDALNVLDLTCPLVNRVCMGESIEREDVVVASNNIVAANRVTWNFIEWSVYKKSIESGVEFSCCGVVKTRFTDMVFWYLLLFRAPNP